VDDNQDMVEEYELKCPLLLEQQVEVSARYGATGTPMGYLIDEEGNIASVLARGNDALLALARPASGIGEPRHGTTIDGQPKIAPASSRVTVAGLSLEPAESKNQEPNSIKPFAKRAFGSWFLKSGFPFRGGNGKVAAQDDHGYDLFELPAAASTAQVVNELSDHAAHCRRLIIAQLAADLGAIGAKELAGIRSFLLKNPDWIVSYREPRGRFFVLSREPRDKKAMPSKFARAANFARAVAIHIGDGARHVTAGQLEERLAMCAMCEQRSGDHCSACGCSLLTKAGWRTAKCPLGKWPALDHQAASKPVDVEPQHFAETLLGGENMLEKK
jgi:hypothetical protein